MALVHLNVGDEVMMTHGSLRQLRNYAMSNVTQMRCDYWEEFKEFVNTRVHGLITHTFGPGYDVTVKFKDKSFHLSSQYLTKVDANGHIMLPASGRASAKKLQLSLPFETVIGRYDRGKYKTKISAGESYPVNPWIYALWSELRTDKDGPYYAVYCLTDA